MRRTLAAILLAGVLVGCGPKKLLGPQPYYGPTLTLSELVSRINANNSRIPTLWARAEMEARIVEENGKVHNEVLSGNLLYRAPREMLLVATKDPVGRVFEVGSNEQIYWMSVRVGPDTAWWGRYENLGKPCARKIPIRPDLVMHVLAVQELSPELLQPPAPVMRFNPDADAYMLVWSVRLPDRWVAVKEIWYDRQTLRPRLVLLFDEHGRVILRAYLADYKPVRAGENVPPERWPVAATNYQLYFPDSGSKLKLQLVDEALTGPRGVPNDRSFRFNPDNAGTAKVVQLDEDCGP